MARTRTVEIELPEAVCKAVVAIAAERGCSPSQVVIDALRARGGWR